MPGITVPAATADSIDHADWLETEALRSADRNSSTQDLASALRRTGSSEEVEQERQIDFPGDPVDDRGGETIEPIAEAAFEEIEDRSKACDGGYPFSLTEGVLQGTTRVRDSLYVFLLLVSKFGKGAGPQGLNVAQLFEEISEVAIKNCLGGERNNVRSFQFGFPRRLTPSSFGPALDELCRVTGEGTQARDRPESKDRKDAGLDVVAWRPFPDGRRGQIMAWGQCATGSDWREKLSDLNPENWAATWMVDRPAAVPLPAFFVPHRIDRDHWETTAINAGVLFDRCRIAAFARPLPRELRAGCQRYNRHVLKEKVLG